MGGCAPNASACAGGVTATSGAGAGCCNFNLPTPDLRDLPTPAKVDFTVEFDTLIAVLSVRSISSPLKTKLGVNAAGSNPNGVAS